MEIPRFWAKSSPRSLRRDGREFETFTWGWSLDSVVDAARVAQERVLALSARHAAPWQQYAYGVRPLQEKILFEKLGPGGEQQLVLTINSYGATVLNSANVLFVDIDIPRPRTHRLLTSIQNIFGRKKPTQPAQDPEAEHLLRLEQFVYARPHWGFRVYRTAAGLRYLATHAPFDPAAAETSENLKSLHCDPMFVLLCQRHKSFRARLSPKPWRCGMRQPPHTFPFHDAKTEQRFEQWHQRYEKASASFSTCHFLQTVGNAGVAAQVQEVVELHDDRSRAHMSLQLA